MGRPIVHAAQWAGEAVSAAACVVLVAERMSTVHAVGKLQLLAASAVAAAIVAGTLAALARIAPPAATPLALVALVIGATRADNARVAVAAFAFAALLPLVALGIATAHSSRAILVLGAVTALAVASRLVLRDPFRELHCEPFCDPNPFLLAHREDVVATTDWLLAAVAAIAVALNIARNPSFKPAHVAAAVTAAIWTLHLAIRPRPIPDSRLDIVLDTALFAAVAAFAIARGRAALAVLEARHQLQAFGRTLAAARDVGSIETSLRRATGDAGLTVALGSGNSSETGIAALGRTSVVRNGNTVAVINHRPDRRERVAAAVTPSVALALETQVLVEQSRRLVAEVDDSRARAAHSTDAARQALERNLHDGAQQHLLVVGMALADAADREANGTGTYRAAASDLAEALRELRRIGRGDAATIAELGLVDATTALEGRATIPISSRVEACSAATHSCWPTNTATAAYRLLVSTVAEAMRGGATAVEFTAQCLGPDSGRRVTIQHDGGADGNRAIDRDRVLAAGGRVEFVEGHGQRNVEAWLP